MTDHNSRDDAMFRKPVKTDSDDEVEDPKIEFKTAPRIMSLESDSLPECSNNLLNRKKRPFRKKKSALMDIDVISRPSTSKADPMDVDMDGFESQLSSSEDERGQGECEADDEQSDWVGYSNGEVEPFNPSDRRARRHRQGKAELSQLEKRLERFALSSHDGEMGLEFKIKDRPNSAHLHRLLLHYRLEVVKRQRGNVVLRKKTNNCACPGD